MRRSAVGLSLGVRGPAVKPAERDERSGLRRLLNRGCGTSKVSSIQGATVRDLVERAQDGDREAFAALVTMTSDRMYALAARILRDNVLAEDALQGALMTVWRQLPTLRDPDRFEAWVRRLLVHACYAEARRRRTWAANVRVLPVDGPAAPDSLICDRRPRCARPGVPTPDRRAAAVFVLHHHVGSPADRDRRHRSASRPGRPVRDSTMRRGSCARPSRPTRHRSPTKDGWHDRRTRLRPLAQAWLELGPDEAPDRVVAAVLQAARDDAAGATSDPLAAPEGQHKMTRLPVLATVAATLVVVIGGLLLINRPNDRGVGAPSRLAVPITSPARQRRHSTWHSDPPAGWAANAECRGSLPTAGTIINFTADDQFFITQSNLNQNHFLNSVASSVGDGQFQLETTATGDGPCSEGRHRSLHLVRRSERSDPDDRRDERRLPNTARSGPGHMVARGLQERPRRTAWATSTPARTSPSTSPRDLTRARSQNGRPTSGP